ncbi:MAG: heme exporter protein CcmD [Candidatus Pelagibacter sp.]
MISEILNMNGYGLYVWSSFMFTLLSFGSLYFVTKIQLNKELRNFESKFKNLDIEKAEVAKKQEIYREILSSTSTSKI